MECVNLKVRRAMARLCQVGLLSIGILGYGATEAFAADTFVIDTKGAHAFIQFKISHLGFSWLRGRFNTFEGEFIFDEKKPEQSSVNVSIKVDSLDSNHAERDKHLRGKDFFAVSKYPNAGFKSKRITLLDDKTADIVGDFTLKGVTKEITIHANYIGGGADPWGGFRQGFEGHTEIRLKDFGIDYDLGKASQIAYVDLYVEGIRQDKGP